MIDRDHDIMVMAAPKDAVRIGYERTQKALQDLAVFGTGENRAMFTIGTELSYWEAVGWSIAAGFLDLDIEDFEDD